VPGEAAVLSFLGLSDTPASYAGQALKGLRANIGESAIEFIDFATLFTPLVHKTTEDALNGLVKVDGAGNYSAIADFSSIVFLGL